MTRGRVRAPGPGRWTRDSARYPRPVTPTLAQLLPRPAVQGFSAATRPYGLLLDHLEWAFVDGRAYTAPRRCLPLRGVHFGDRAAWDALVDSSVDLRRRLAASSRVFDRRIWRAELDRWYQRDRPHSIATNSAIARGDPAALDSAHLVRHLADCRANLQRAIRLHHRYDVTPAVAVGDVFAHVAEWTGSPPAAGADLLVQGSRSAACAIELRDVATDGWWIAGAVIDIDELCFAELPGAITDALRHATDPRNDMAAARDSESRIRARVPAASRREFDEMVAEARAVHRLRDERALYSDVWAMGLLRRAVLAAGVRLCDSGLIDAPADALEADPAELRTLLTRGAPRPALSERAHSRSAAGDDMPAELGEAPWAPIPVDWLPAGAARTERAFRAFLAAMDAAGDAEDADHIDDTAELHGLPASPGIHAGRARIVRSAADLARIEAGDVLVAAAASPSLVVGFELAGALVTDHGGTLSHAALVARERGMPAVVGTGDATRRLVDGARVRVDGSTGRVDIIDP